MQHVSLEYYLAFSRHLVIRAGQVAMKHFRHVQGWLKDNKSPVTEADLQIEELVKGEILRKFPGHVFLGEETNGESRDLSGAEWIWVLDPIDGTGAYFSGLPVWGVSLALLHHGRPVVGAFYQPVTRELFHATADAEAMYTLNPGAEDEENRAIHVETDPSINGQSLFLVSSSLHRNWNSDFIGKQRTMGSTAAHQCVVARGAAVATIQAPSIWDIAASALIVRQAGGVVRCLDTGEDVDFTKYLAGNFRMPWLMAAASGQVWDDVSSMLSAREGAGDDAPAC